MLKLFLMNIRLLRLQRKMVHLKLRLGMLEEKIHHMP